MIKVKIEGVDKLIRGLDQEIIAGPARKMLTDVGKAVQGNARKNAVYDRGGLRDSIKFQVDSRAMPLYVEVGTNIEYGRAIELGRPPGKMPPVSALEDWGRRRGMPAGSGWPLALKIMQHGTKPRPYLGPAVEEVTPKIPRLVTAMARDIEREAAKRGGG